MDFGLLANRSLEIEEQLRKEIKKEQPELSPVLREQSLLISKTGSVIVLFKNLRTRRLL